MSDIITQAVAALTEKMTDADFDASAKFSIEGEGSIVIDSSGVNASEAEADVTLSASAETFQAILSGDENPMTAYMTGKLTVDGDMGTAMKLAGVLS